LVSTGWAQVKVAQDVSGDAVATEYLDNYIHNGISDNSLLEKAYIWDVPDFDWVLDVHVFEDPDDTGRLIIFVTYVFHPKSIINSCSALTGKFDDTAGLWENWVGVNLGVKIYFIENSPDPVMNLGYEIVDDLIVFINDPGIMERTGAWK
jgi:hypothetical protein